MAKPGEKVKFEEYGVELIVTKGGDGEITASGGDAVQVGKRYECESSGIQVLIVKPGAAALHCNGAPMVLQEPKKTKAAD
jgi:hypothetical protein